MTRDKMEQLAAQLAAGIYSPAEVLDAVDDDYDIFSAIMDIANGEEPAMPIMSQPLFEDDNARDIGLLFSDSALMYYVIIDGKNTYCGVPETAMYDLGINGTQQFAEHLVDDIVDQLTDINYTISNAERKELLKILGF